MADTSTGYFQAMAATRQALGGSSTMSSLNQLALGKERLALQAQRLSLSEQTLEEKIKAREEGTANAKVSAIASLLGDTDNATRVQAANAFLPESEQLPAINDDATFTELDAILASSSPTRFEEARTMGYRAAGRHRKEEAAAFRAQVDARIGRSFLRPPLVDRRGHPSLYGLFQQGVVVTADQLKQRKWDDTFGTDATPPDLQVVPDEVYAHLAETQQLQEGLQALGPEQSLRVTNTLIRRQEDLPTTIKDEQELDMFARFESLRRNPERTPPEEDEFNDLRSYYKMSQPQPVEDQLYRAKVRKLLSQVDAAEAATKGQEYVDQLHLAQAQLAKAQADKTEQGNATYQERLEQTKALTEANIDKLKAYTAKIQTDTSLAPQKQAMLLQHTQARIGYLESLRKMQGTLTVLREYEMARKQMEGQRKTKEDDRAWLLNEQKLELAKKRLALDAQDSATRLKRVDALNQLTKKQLLEGYGGLKQLDISRKQKSDIELTRFQEEQLLTPLLNTFVTEGGDPDDRKAIGKLLQQAGITTIPVGKAQEMAGLKASSKLKLEITNPNAPTVAGVTRSQDTQDSVDFGLKFLDKLESTVTNLNVGAIGKFRNFMQGVSGQASAVATLLTAQKEEVVNKVKQVGVGDTNPNNLFDPQLTDFQSNSRIAAYLMAAAIAEQKGRALSDIDRQEFEKVLGFRANITDENIVKQNIENARQLLFIRLGIADRRLRGEAPNVQDNPLLQGIQKAQTPDDLFKLLPQLQGATP